MRRNGRKNRTATLIVLIIILVIALVGLVVLLFRDKKSDNGNDKNNNATNNTKVTAESETDTTPAQTEAPTAAASEPPTEAPTAAPVVEPGNWDLSALPNDKTPYGNNPDDRIECGIPSGILWYQNKWGQFNVDFISQKGIDYKDGKTTEKVVYLTMDCGFDSPHYEPILDILKEKKVKATFFVTSMFYDARPDLVERMIKEGHNVGSHSINHKDMTTLSIEEQKTEIMDVVNRLKKDFNYTCTMFRFPEGVFSDQCLGVVNNLGLKAVFWSYAYNDFASEQPPVKESLDKAVKYLHPGAIYLLHASSSTNRAFLGDWIDAARNAGYVFGGPYC